MIHVLIVEDDPMVAEINKLFIVEIEGYELKGIAHSVKEAMEILSKERIDLILLDIFMPEEDGFQLLTNIRQKQKDIDVILITAASDIKNIHRALQYGAVDYIIKPFHFERFKTALIKYREQTKVIKEQLHMSQEELDRLFLDTGVDVIEPNLPKGLTKHTLKEIWNHISKFEDTVFSTEDIAELTGLSRISVRKYLAFLEKINILSTEVSYGGIGRPLTLYSVLKGNEKGIEHYI